MDRGIIAKIDRDYLGRDDANLSTRIGDHWTIRHLAETPEYDDGVDTSSWKKVRFRLLDDDEIPYYGGWLLNDDECVVQTILLDWAMWDSGCTIIEVKLGEEWVREIG